MSSECESMEWEVCTDKPTHAKHVRMSILERLSKNYPMVKLDAAQSMRTTERKEDMQLILATLSDEPRTIRAIARETGMTTNTVKSRMKALIAANQAVVDSRRRSHLYSRPRLAIPAETDMNTREQ